MNSRHILQVFVLVLFMVTLSGIALATPEGNVPAKFRPRDQTYKGSWIQRTHFDGGKRRVFLGRRLSRSIAKEMGITLGRSHVISIRASVEQPLPGFAEIFGQGKGGTLFLGADVAMLGVSKRTGRPTRKTIAWSDLGTYMVKLDKQLPDKLTNEALLRKVVDEMAEGMVIRAPQNAVPYQR